MIKLIAIWIAALCLCTACLKKSEPVRDDLFAAGVSVGTVDKKDIKEASGLAASVLNQGMFWTHNDNGDKARIFLIDSLGKHRATVSLEGVRNRDWEDIAVGPGPDSSKVYVYIGDIGDNHARYDYKYVYRIEEPHVADDNKKYTVNKIDSIRFVLPGGARDTESLMIDPETKYLYVFSKREYAVYLYKLPYPQSTKDIQTAEIVLEAMPFSNIVAADWSADGREILIKDYSRVYYWKRTKNESIDKLLSGTPIRLPYEREPQGESIAFDRTGNGYYTISESGGGKKPELMFYKRRRGIN